MLESHLYRQWLANGHPLSEIRMGLKHWIIAYHSSDPELQPPATQRRHQQRGTVDLVEHCRGEAFATRCQYEDLGCGYDP